MKKEAPSDSVEVLGQKSLTVILDEIEKRANAATPEPWVKRPSVFSVYNVPDVATSKLECLCIMDSAGASIPKAEIERNATFIAAARSDVPALARALRRAVEMLKWAVEGDAALLHHREKELAQLLSEPAGSAYDGPKPDSASVQSETSSVSSSSPEAEVETGSLEGKMRKTQLPLLENWKSRRRQV